MTDMTLVPGEWIISGRSSSKYDRELAAINAGIEPPTYRIEWTGNIQVHHPVKASKP